MRTAVRIRVEQPKENKNSNNLICVNTLLYVDTQGIVYLQIHAYVTSVNKYNLWNIRNFYSKTCISASKCFISIF